MSNGPSQKLPIREGTTSAASGYQYVAQQSANGNRFSVPVPGSVVKRSMAQVDAMTIAERIVDFCHEHGDVVTNLKLQKLLYYAQAWYVAINDKPLFNDRFEAWPHGPTQPDVYKTFRQFGERPIEKPSRRWELPKKVDRHIADLMTSYGRLSAFELERLACQEQPWMEARQGLDADEHSDKPLSIDTMKSYYRMRLDEQKGRRK